MLKDIKRTKTDNLGGINSYIFIPVESVVSIPPVLNGSVRMAISIKPGTKWYKGHGIEYTMQFADDQQDNDHGSYFEKKLSGSIAKNRASLTEQINEMKNRRFIVIATDNNEIMWLIGTIEEPLVFKVTTNTKANVPERNEIVFEFSGQGISKSPVFSGLCPLTGFQ